MLAIAYLANALVIGAVFTYQCKVDMESISNNLGVWFDAVLANEWELSDKEGDGHVMKSLKHVCSGLSFAGYEDLLVQSKASSRCSLVSTQSEQVLLETATKAIAEKLDTNKLTRGHCQTWFKYSQYCLSSRMSSQTSSVAVKSDSVDRHSRSQPRKVKISVSPVLDIHERAMMKTATTTTSMAPTMTSTTIAPTCEECLDVKSFTCSTSPRQILSVWPLGKCWPKCDAFNVANVIREARKKGFMTCGNECDKVPALVAATDKLIETCMEARLAKNWRLRDHWKNLNAAERDYVEMVNLLKSNLNWGIKQTMDHWFRAESFGFTSDMKHVGIYQAAQAVWLKENRR